MKLVLKKIKGSLMIEIIVATIVISSLSIFIMQAKVMFSKQENAFSAINKKGADLISFTSFLEYDFFNANRVTWNKFDNQLSIIKNDTIGYNFYSNGIIRNQNKKLDTLKYKSENIKIKSFKIDDNKELIKQFCFTLIIDSVNQIPFTFTKELMAIDLMEFNNELSYQLNSFNDNLTILRKSE